MPVKFEPGSKPPVMLFLHGAGERGNNNLDQIMVGLGPAIWKRKGNFPFVTIIPQCRTGSNWLDEANSAMQSSDGGMMGALQNAKNNSGSVRSFLANSQQAAGALAMIGIMLARPRGLWPSPRHEDQLAAAASDKEAA